MAWAEFWTAETPGMPPEEMRSLLLERRYSERTAFLSVVVPYRKQPTVSNVIWGDSQIIKKGVPVFRFKRYTVTKIGRLL